MPRLSHREHIERASRPLSSFAFRQDDDQGLARQNMSRLHTPFYRRLPVKAAVARVVLARETPCSSPLALVPASWPR
jgi:hypothetical protein